jgi:hypothetical protein
MVIVLFHSGVLPGYLKYTFSQIRIFNPDVVVYFITNKEHLKDDVFKEYNIIPVNKDLYHSDKISSFERLYKKPGFWTITATRLIYIENFIRKKNLTDVYHFENDVLLYYDLKELHDIFINLFKGLAITRGGTDKCMTGFMFIKNAGSISEMTDFFISLLSELGVNGIKNKYRMDMVNEMTLMSVYFASHGGSLPTMPHSEYANQFNSIFDPASYGQFVGGTTNGMPGAKPKDHYIGQMLTENPSFDIIWNNKRQPCLKYNDNEIRINNLHIHSKNLHLYTSD